MKEVGGGIVRLEGSGRTANAFLVDADRPVVVDAGTPRGGRRIAAELTAAGVVPAVILLTHSHHDHAGGAAALREATGAPIWAPAAERGLLTGLARQRRFVGAATRVANLGRATVPPSVDRWLEPGELIEGIEAVPTPGHTAGHTSYCFGTSLVAGDAFMTGEPLREAVPLFIADRAEARRSIEMLAGLDLDLAVSGHGPPVRGAAAKLRALVETWS